LATRFDCAAASAAAAPLPARLAALHRLEQVLLLTRLAADTGARRGELAALQVGDLDAGVLTVARAVSAEQVGPTKTGRRRRLTLGESTTRLWRDTVEAWAARQELLGPWLFSARLDHGERVRTDNLAHWFATLAADCGHPEVTLHRLRHTVATTLVAREELLAAQERLGHRDASTTLRIYSHALPLHDQQTAALLDALYRM
jgi:integrase